MSFDVGQLSLPHLKSHKEPHHAVRMAQMIITMTLRMAQMIITTTLKTLKDPLALFYSCHIAELQLALKPRLPLMPNITNYCEKGVSWQYRLFKIPCTILWRIVHAALPTVDIW